MGMKEILGIYVDLQLYYTLQQFLLCTLALLKVHQIETKVTLKDQGNCRFIVFLFFLLSIACLLLTIHMLLVNLNMMSEIFQNKLEY